MRMRILIGVLCGFLTMTRGMAAPDVLVYYPDFRSDQSAGLQTRFGHIYELAFSVYRADAKGRIASHVPRADMDFARAKGLRLVATVTNYSGKDFDPAIAHAIMTSPEQTQAFIQGMQTQMAQEKCAGFNLDFESVAAGDRDDFSRFVATVSSAMKAAGYFTVVSVPAKQKEDPTSSWSGAYDLKAIGAAADVVQVMAYDEHGPWSTPGPVAGLDWVEATVQYTVSAVPPGKISLGFPAFGYDYDLTNKSKSNDIAWAKIPQLIKDTGAVAQWDDASSSPWFRYTLYGHDHVVWHENARSLGLKAQLVAKYQLGGISVWALGMEDEEFWEAVNLKASP